MKDYRLYILMRTDLPSMGAGRAAAQASHASNAFVHKFGKHQEVKNWQNQTTQGFGTAIVLGTDKVTIDKLFHLSPLKLWVMKDEVHDPDYVILINREIESLLRKQYNKHSQFWFDLPKPDGLVPLHRVEMTCAYVFGAVDDPELTDIRKLPLYG